MQEETLYKIISIVLLPFAAILAFLTLIMLLMSIANPVLLLIALLSVCVLLYLLFSMKFFWGNILKNKAALPKMRNRIRRTGFITGLFLFNAILSFGSAIVDKSIVMQATHKVYEIMEPQLRDAAKTNPAVASFTESSLFQIYNAIIIIALVYCLILLLHLLMSFKFLAKYRYLFEDNAIQ